MGVREGLRDTGTCERGLYIVGDSEGTLFMRGCKTMRGGGVAGDSEGTLFMRGLCEWTVGRGCDTVRGCRGQ